MGFPRASFLKALGKEENNCTRMWEPATFEEQPRAELMGFGGVMIMHYL